MVALLLLARVALAADVEVRDITGRPVEIGGHAQALVYWTMRDPSALARVAELEARGAEVILVSADAASEHAMLRPFLRARGIEGIVVADPAGQLRGQFAPLPGGQVAVLGDAADGPVIAAR